jgi:hypothetical protein
MKKVGFILIEAVELLRFLVKDFIVLLGEAFGNDQWGVFFGHNYKIQ